MADSGTVGLVRVGGRLAVDLLNTVGSRDGRPPELLEDPEDLSDWAETAGIPYASEIGRRSPQTIAELREFREVLREALLRWRAGTPVSADLIGRLNRELARDPRHLLLDLSNGRIATRLVSTGDPLDRLYADLAASLAMMLSRDTPFRFRPCANEGCRLMFYDDSKPGTRRWCSMELCGSRAKARAFRLRHGVTRS